jgi:hypothetical protein
MSVHVTITRTGLVKIGLMLTHIQLGNEAWVKQNVFVELWVAKRGCIQAHLQ